MNYSIDTLPSFDKKVKKLAKKYKSLKSDLRELVKELMQNPTAGADLGNGVRKVRMAISNKGKGKSHGARVITYTTIISVEEGIITLLAIYDKAEQNTITEKEISLLLKEI
ncbi:type II toxin-antitoxin system RelE/ParE family toxin [Parabacteroides goldsteinii]|uniref:type II toxin-antitoxin system RelE/ParE family toxin n=1 Tax=Parabacteroides goldsteinii TaxID=328812 RepID=UPI00101D05AF|nr:type II toxin-antitoxin system RelE/ParE family toxin [Parabacteroides goldsteinii]